MRRSKIVLEEYDVLQCVDRGLGCFGTNVKQSVYWQVTILYNSLHECVIKNPRTFASLLHELFSDSARGIEASIIQELRGCFGDQIEEEEDLAVALDQARGQIVCQTY